MGFDVLCDGQRAFINCTRDLLLKDGITLCLPSQTVVEILEKRRTGRPGGGRLRAAEGCRLSDRS